jgi:23S rRNA (pseudouridine1915-N3)-methyltransferase
MLLHVVAAGTRMPAWVNAGYREYANRLQGADYRMELTEVPLGQRSGADVARAIAAEGGRMLAAAGERCYLVALQVRGESWSTARLARWLDERAREGDPIAFCIGGPDGLAGEIDARARLRWSLSPLTLPHGVARVVAAEALYRAVSLIKGLPYHRA